MTEPVTVRRVRECSMAVLAHVRIEDVHVLDASFHGVHPVQDGPFEVDWSVQIKAQQEEVTLDCFSRYEVTATGAEGAEAWAMQLELVGSWRMADDTPEFDDEHRTCFALAVGVPALHPYAREAIQSGVSRLGYPPFTMEMITSVANRDPDDVIDLTGEAT